MERRRPKGEERSREKEKERKKVKSTVKEGWIGKDKRGEREDEL